MTSWFFATVMMAFVVIYPFAYAVRNDSIVQREKATSTYDMATEGSATLRARNLAGNMARWHRAASVYCQSTSCPAGPIASANITSMMTSSFTPGEAWTSFATATEVVTYAPGTLTVPEGRLLGFLGPAINAVSQEAARSATIGIGGSTGIPAGVPAGRAAVVSRIR